MILKVGKSIIGDVKPRLFAYRDIEYQNGWADAEKYLPLDYDLVMLKLGNGKMVSGWSVGHRWAGLRLKKNDVVVEWKYEKELYNEM